ncbi:Gfo/Idh/MocA family oxidoreductase [Nocardiopsis tropica]|uniref:Gfo/Idh/MocA family oxidoreductase n=1 Tax=Nocardiopsis tropica TaxID=109330 RepID=A0ABU7KMZ1_9ACTN|nr:Gfo/Idh/MocA family oxidoreductase [Nocardiopsis umidischolae]MEE2050658.1 Gfo/Idh/MocA family oxidoreductase [Nocardiopsis umidischolae]
MIIGCGAIAGRWLRGLAADPRVEVAAFIDTDTRAASALAQRFGSTAPVFSCLPQALTELSGAEVAVNLTPIEHHTTITGTALRAGLHVLTEKPVALTLAQAHTLVETARMNGRMLAVMQNRGHDPGLAALRGRLHASSHGPLLVRAETMVTLHRPGFRAHLPHPVTADLAPHAFDQIRQLVKAPPIRVRCTETPLRFLGGHCALSTVDVEFADGSVFTYRGGYTTARPLRTSANGRWHVEGADLAASWDGDTTIIHGSPSDTEHHAMHLPDTPPAYRQCLSGMIDALHHTPPNAVHPAHTVADSLESTALLEAALTSAVTGTPAPVPSTHQVPR